MEVNGVGTPDPEGITGGTIDCQVREKCCQIRIESKPTDLERVQELKPAVDLLLGDYVAMLCLPEKANQEVPDIDSKG